MHLRALILTFPSLLLGIGGASALPITGEIHFGGQFLPIDSGGTSVSLGSATGIQFVNPSVVLVASGDFAQYVTPWISQATFTSSFNFDPLSPVPVQYLWSAGGFNFTLNAIQIVYHDNLQLNLLGSGFISGNGFDTTVGSWNFQGGGSGFFTFRANDTASGIAVPDGGDTLLLLGAAFLVLGFLASRKQPRKAVLKEAVVVVRNP